jgi:hypothetical protein
VRLDHLLSKEHLPAKAGKEPALPGCGGGVLDGGDTGGSAWADNGPRVSTAGLGGLVGKAGGGCGWSGASNTLLGPEAISVSGLFRGSASVWIPRRVPVRFARDGVGLVLVENCTVDASIFL